MDPGTARSRLSSIGDWTIRAVYCIPFGICLLINWRQCVAPDDPPYWLYSRSFALASDWVQRDFIDAATPLAEVRQWKLKLLELYKCRPGAGHGICVATFRRFPEGDWKDNTLYVRFGGCVLEEDGDDSSSTPRGGVLSRLGTVFASPHVGGSDTVTILNREDLDESIKTLKARVQRRLRFDKTASDCPTVLDLAVIVETHSKEAPQYYPYGSCLNVLKETHGGTLTDPGKLARKLAAVPPNRPRCPDGNWELVQNIETAGESSGKEIQQDSEPVPAFDELVQESRRRAEEVATILSQYKTRQEKWEEEMRLRDEAVWQREEATRRADRYREEATRRADEAVRYREEATRLADEAARYREEAIRHEAERELRVLQEARKLTEQATQAEQKAPGAPQPGLDPKSEVGEDSRSV